jgi:hypothetical protein
MAEPIFAPLSIDKRRIFMIHGRPGAGKTHMLGTAVRGTTESMAILDFKGGLNTISDLVGKTVPGTSRPYVYQARAQNLDTFEKIWNAIHAVRSAVANGFVQWVAVDNVTDMSAAIMHEVRTVQVRGDGGEAKAISSRRSLGDYGWCLYRTQEIVNLLTSIEANVVFTAWSKTDKDGFMFPRTEAEGISDMIAGACQHIFHLKAVAEGGNIVVEADKPPTARRLLYTDSGEFMARNQGGVLPPVMEPNFREVIRILSENGL